MWMGREKEEDEYDACEYWYPSECVSAG
jgi:hypothetical protein